MKEKRLIVHIDQALCNGCGEGAIEIRGGKARLLAENLATTSAPASARAPGTRSS